MAGGSPSPLVVRGLADAYTLGQLETARGEAATALLAEKGTVVLTSISLEGGGGSGEVVVDNPERVMALVQAAIDFKLNRGQPGLASSMQFCRRSET